jgi:hypothetical protein
MYGSLTLTSPQEIGLMRAEYVLRVFAAHLNSIVGAEEVHDLEIPGDYEDLDQAASEVARYPPTGALALAAAAVSTYVYIDNTG